MKQVFLMTFTFSLSVASFGQSNDKNIFRKFYNSQINPHADKKGQQVFAEINPQFFAFGGYGGGLGLEFSRFQTGLIYLNTKLTPTFRDAIFDDAENLEVPKNWATEIFANVFLRKDRKGFYAGSILSYDGYSVTDVPTQKKENFTKTYVVARVGFRWFPFQEHFYIDGGYGISVNLDGPAHRTLGNTTYNLKTTVTLPFLAIGGRFTLGIRKK